MFFGRTDAKAEIPILCPPHAKSWLLGKDSDAGRELGAGGEEDDREWDGWMASLTRWTCIWVSSGSWWWTGMPGVLWFMGSQKVGHDWATELNWTEPTPVFLGFPCGSAGKESACNAGIPGFNAWVGNISWRMERLPTPVFWPGEFHRLYSLCGRKESDTTERLSLPLGFPGG